MVDCIFVDVDNTLLCSAYYDLSIALQEAIGNGLVTFAEMQPPVPMDKLERACGPLDKVVGTSMDPYVCRVRPMAAEFLDQLRGIAGKVIALSAGQRDFQLGALSAHGLLDKLDEVYGWDSLVEVDQNFVVPKSSKSLLVDDLHPFSIYPIMKMGVIGLLDRSILNTPDGYGVLDGIVTRHYVQVKAYNGEVGDGGLAEALPEVRRKAAQL